MNSWLQYVCSAAFVVSSLLLFFSLKSGLSQSKDRGIVICSGPGELYLELLALLYDLKIAPDKHIWKVSELPITVAHCDELPETEQYIIASLFPQVSVVNICYDEPKQVKDRLRGFFCKPAAMLKSPYTQTMLMDTDVILLHDLAVLFDYSGFINTGTLFFRDRWTQTKSAQSLTAGSQKANRLFNYIKSVSSTLKRKPESGIISLDNKTAMLEHNSYWYHYFTGRGKSLDHLQDSSVVMMNMKRVPVTFEAMQTMLKDFSMGYGDKEIYWLAATAAGEPFSFEPYMAGSLGDCGAIVHFDPSNHTTNQTKPLFINAEYLIDINKIKSEGDFIDPSDTAKPKISRPHLAATMQTDVHVLTNWKKMKHGFYPCGACELFDCVDLDTYTIGQVQNRQKMILKLKQISVLNKETVAAVFGIRL